MFAKFLYAFALIGLSAAGGDEKPKEGVDPNTLQCDPEGQGCNWPNAGKCILRDPKYDDIEGSGEEEEEGSGFWQPEEQMSFGIDVESDAVHSKSDDTALFASILDCRKIESATRQVPYKGDCQRYWRCVDGAIQTAYCSDGLFFNAQTQQCDFEANAKCDVQLEENELEGEYIVYK